MSRCLTIDSDAEPIVGLSSSDDSEDSSVMNYLSDSSDSDNSSSFAETSLTDEHKKAVQGIINEFCKNLKAYFGEHNTEIDYALRNFILRRTRQAEEDAFAELSQEKQLQQRNGV